MKILKFNDFVNENFSMDDVDGYEEFPENEVNKKFKKVLSFLGVRTYKDIELIDAGLSDKLSDKIIDYFDENKKCIKELTLNSIDEEDDPHGDIDVELCTVTLPSGIEIKIVKHDDWNDYSDYYVSSKNLSLLKKNFQ